jgi:hypothetical protein
MKNNFKSYEQRKELIENRKEEFERLQAEKFLEIERQRFEAEKQRLEEIQRLAKKPVVIYKTDFISYRLAFEMDDILRVQAELLKYNVKKEVLEIAGLNWQERA